MTTTAALPEVWMKLHNRKLLLKLMAIQNVSNRTLAYHAGYKSHSYVNRLVSGDVDTLGDDAALRIAKYLGVGYDDLFLTQLSSDARQTAKRKRAA